MIRIENDVKQCNERAIEISNFTIKLSSTNENTYWGLKIKRRVDAYEWCNWITKIVGDYKKSNNQANDLAIKKWSWIEERDGT